MSIRKIAVLFHENTARPDFSLIHYIAEVWRSEGIEVVYLFGTAEYVPADVLIVHVDLSVVPASYIAFSKRYPIVLNQRVTDIRKSSFSTGLLTPDSDWPGQVIVKTEMNNFGRAERLVGTNWLERRFALARRIRWAIDRRLPSKRAFADLASYRLFSSLAEVPRSWFRSRDVVVEKFRPERTGDLYHLRICQVLGDRTLSTRLTSREPIIKMHTSIASERIDEEPFIAGWRDRFGLDYGKLDYVIYDGEPVLLDINKTTGTSPERAPQFVESHRLLASGISHYE